MARKPSKTEWHQQHGLWCRTIGSRGARIRLFERTKGGVYYRAVWIPGKGISRRSLNTRNRFEADRLGRELLAAVLKRDEWEREGVLRLGELWNRYSHESVSFLDNDDRTKRDAAGHAAVLLGFFDSGCDVSRITEQDQLAFVQKRLAGGIECRNGRVTMPVRTRSVEVELQLLHTMLRWATTTRTAGGKRLLDHNPLAGVRRPREKNPKRPVATWERYQATRTRLQTLAANATTEFGRRKWTMVELALMIAEATGRRLGSIRQLRWDDIDFAAGTIRWRAEADKRGREWLVPLPTSLLLELKSFRLRLGGVFGGLLFPRQNDPSAPISRDSFGHWLKDAETRAGLPKLDGSLWHAYRRSWATARKGLPVKDVAHAGGWSDTATLIGCYQQADAQTLLDVMSHPKKLSDRRHEG